MYIKSYIIRNIKFILIKWPRRVIYFLKFIAIFFTLRKKNDGRLTLKTKNLYPCLKDKTSFTPIDQHYIYHPAWAARILAKTKPSFHVDISSILHFGSIISAFIPIKFYDYRPATLHLSNYESSFVDLKKLSFESDSIESLSCMHTIEHIGLGRYGDTLDLNGDLTSIHELKRVLKSEGNLLFVTPVGNPRIEFNAHRIYSYEQIITYFSPLQLMEFSLIPDKGGIIENADPALVKQQNYGCGCFWFKK